MNQLTLSNEPYFASVKNHNAREMTGDLNTNHIFNDKLLGIF